MTIRILLVDDHQLFLQGLRSLLAAQEDFDIVAEALDGHAAVKAVRALSPDVVVMDTTMPGMNGIEATRRILAASPATRILSLSMHASPHLVEHALDAGAAGYLLKENAVDDLVHAIREVYAGRSYLSPGVTGIVVEAMKRRSQQTDARDVAVALTDREREILQLLAEGHSTARIADRLCLSIKTVASHRQHLMDKLGIHSIAGLTKFAIQEGLTSAAP